MLNEFSGFKKSLNEALVWNIFSFSLEDLILPVVNLFEGPFSKLQWILYQRKNLERMSKERHFHSLRLKVNHMTTLVFWSLQNRPKLSMDPRPIVPVRLSLIQIERI